MSFVLLDWTRMGKGYCLAGAVLDGTQARVIRPLCIALQRGVVGSGGLIATIRSFFVREPPPEGERGIAWPAHVMVGRSRWEVLDLISPRAATPHPPHLEDTWVRSLRPRKRLATREERRAILEATAGPTAKALFGAPLQTAGARTFAKPGQGERSLSTLLAPAAQIQFHAGDGVRESGSARIRASIPFPDLGVRTLPVTDHHLLTRVEKQAPRPAEQAEILNELVGQMGETVAVRLGLSRPYAGDNQPAVCWLMANGFFSLTDPQP